MKVVKSISLFFLMPLTMLTLGFWAGVKTEHFFYPGGLSLAEEAKTQMPEATETEAEGMATDEINENIVQPDTAKTETVKPDAVKAETVQAETANQGIAKMDEVQSAPAQSLPVWSGREVLSADTEYVVLETDVLHDTEVETIWHVPSQYMGMDREQFVTAMDNYSKYPPLSEKERGFVNSEVLSFSGERVEIRMNYRSVGPDEGFYLAVRDHEVVVYLEDKETIYINTGILLETLPEEVQLQVINMLYMENEEKLYGFLEAYSS